LSAIVALDHAFLTMPDRGEDEARRFYGRLLGLAHPGFRVGSPGELDELAERLVAGQYEVDWDDRIEGRRRFYTRDPFGNRLELLADL
jgi:hypothetical protein